MGFGAGLTRIQLYRPDSFRCNGPPARLTFKQRAPRKACNVPCILPVALCEVFMMTAVGWIERCWLS